ncbi:MAG: gamma-glutamyltransferase [Polyangiales bacterium]
MIRDRKPKRFRRTITAGISIGAAVLLVAPWAQGWFYAPFSARRFAAAADNADASRAAVEVLRAGGNAVDAAIAASLALGVVSPSSSGFGGGGFALVCQPTGGRCTFVDFRETAPAALTIERIRNAANPSRASQVGGLAVGVPGEPMGFIEMARRYGRKPLSVSVGPAVRLARNGFRVSPFLADRLAQERPELQSNPAFASVFSRGGVPFSSGELLRRPRLATTLERYGREGERFVHGALAQAIESTVRAAGGVLTADDIRGYHSVERTPLSRVFRGATVVTAPPPSAGGVVLLETLAQYDALAARNLPLVSQTSATFHALADAFKHGFDDRARYVGDPGNSQLDRPSAVAESLLAPARLAQRHRTFDASRARPVVVIEPARDQGTTHLCVIDSDGMAVSLTTTVNLSFGSRVVVDSMDVLLNDQIDDFSLGTAGNNFGLANSTPNALAVGRRPISSMAPTIVLRDGRPVLAAGASGGPRIATATTQVILNVLAHGMNVEAAVASPRIHHQGAPDVLLVEREVSEDVRLGLRARGYQVQESDTPLAAATAISVGEIAGTRALFASSDPRKQGGAPAGE